MEKKIIATKYDSNGIAAELFVIGGSARIRVYDVDAGGNYSMTIYPTFEMAKKVFDEIKAS